MSVVAMWYSILQRFRATAAMGVAWAAPHRAGLSLRIWEVCAIRRTEAGRSGI